MSNIEPVDRTRCQLRLLLLLEDAKLTVVAQQSSCHLLYMRTAALILWPSSHLREDRSTFLAEVAVLLVLW